MATTVKGILLDRDGVLIENRPDYVRSILEVQIISGVPSAIQKLWQAQYKICVVTNQAGVAKGMYSYQTVQEIHHYIENLLQVTPAHPISWYVCPHQDKDNCTCRKPKSGLLLQAIQENFFDPKKTWMVGDNRHDIAAGRSIGCPTALVQTGLGKSQVFHEGWQPTVIVADLPTFVDHLLQNPLD